jgi:tetratricopeptide (TPR) repeat protein
MSSEWWNEGVAEVCEHFQLDLSCLVDGELDEAAASRAMLHLESCADCREFFEETRACVRMHRDMADPTRLLAQVAALTGAGLAAGDDIPGGARAIELVSRLASIFYQLGKAYVLAVSQPDQRTRVFERAVPVEPTQARGRGFVDGVLLSAGDEVGGVDWRGARGLLNGRLKQIESPLEKGRRLLDEALQVDPSHEEARIYLAYLHALEGKRLRAAGEYRTVFRTALDERNRGHAAVQLGRLHDAEGDHRRALACFRWVRASGLARREERFFFVDFNIGAQYAHLGQSERSLAAFRRLLDHSPHRLAEIAGLFAESRGLQAAIESRPGFLESLIRTCPELFGDAAPGPSGTPHGTPPEPTL